MQAVEAILFEPVGCLAEFPAEPFNEIASRVFGRKKKPSRSGSRSYWHLLNLIGAAGGKLEGREVEALELEAVAAASVFEDVPPALAELGAMGIRLILASSLSAVAVARFVEKCGGFSASWSRETAGGVKADPLQSAIRAASLSPAQTLFLTDTAEGIKAGRAAGVHPILMMNDPDEAKRLALQDPVGGIVSMHELPDFIRLVSAQNARPR